MYSQPQRENRPPAERSSNDLSVCRAALFFQRGKDLARRSAGTEHLIAFHSGVTFHAGQLLQCLRRLLRGLSGARFSQIPVQRAGDPGGEERGGDLRLLTKLPRADKAIVRRQLSGNVPTAPARRWRSTCSS